MKRIHCVVEGQTEVQVFSSLLTPYIYKETGAHILFTPIKHTGGGIVKFSKIFPELRNHLKDKRKIVTTFFDYYGINSNLEFKFFKESKTDQNNPELGVQLLEKGMTMYLDEKGINTKNFIPYIQLHEFEALLFSASKGFEFQFDNPKILRKLEEVIRRYDNPERINDSPNTAPSKRISTILEENGEKYIKTTDGDAIAREVGIETMFSKCPRFSNWVHSIISKVKNE